jgi:glycosyltransferase involved in cell wall biosynthesis
VKEQIKLSICMMVKNEEKNIDRCLASLYPLLANGTAELIIVDTGSTDNTVNIASKYTEKVYYKPWENDFSGMRNYTISLAKGSWIFIIDADEELIGLDQLNQLLQSEKIITYNSIQLQVRNFTYSNNLELFTTLMSPRFFKNDGSFGYKGTVHNQPMFKTPILHLDEIYVNHYGYVKDDEELMDRKFERTSKLLIQELEKNPNNPYYRFQLAQSYGLRGKMEKAYDEIKKAYELLNNREEKFAKLYIFGVYANVLYSLKKYEETIKLCQEGISLGKEYIDLYFYLASSQYKLQKFDLALENFKIYFDLLTNLDQLNLGKSSAIEFTKIDKGSITVAAFRLSTLYYNNQQWDNGLKVAERISDEEIKYKQISLGYMNIGDMNSLYQLYSEIESNLLKDKIEDLIENNKLILENNQSNDLYRIFSKGERPYNYLNKIRMSDRTKNRELMYYFLNHFDLTNIKEYYAEIFIELIASRELVLPYLKHISDSPLIKIVDEMIKKDKFSVIRLVKETPIRKNDFHLNRVLNLVASRILFTLNNTDEHITKEENMDIFNIYLHAGWLYLKSIYQENKLRLIYKTIGYTEHKLLMTLLIGDQLMGSGNRAGALNYFKEAIEIYPKFRKLIRAKFIEV